MNSQQSALRVARREAALRGKKVAVLNPADQHMYTVEPQQGTVVEKAVDPAHPKGDCTDCAGKKWICACGGCSRCHPCRPGCKCAGHGNGTDPKAHAY